MKKYIIASRKIPRVGTRKIRDWYIKKYPTDDLGLDIDPEVTFNNLLVCLDFGEDVYNCLGVGDSVIRERCFAELARLMKVKYDYIYDLWLNDYGLTDRFISEHGDPFQQSV